MHFTRRLCSYYKKYLHRTMTDPHRVGYNKTRKAVFWKPVYGLQTRNHEKHWEYSRSPPYTTENYNRNVHPDSSVQPFYLTRPYKDPVIFSGDRVQITKGEDKGKIGIVEEVVTETGDIYVAGLNLKYDIYEKAGDMVISTSQGLKLNKGVSLIDPGDEKPTKAEWRYDESGEKVRVSARSGRIIPLPRDYYDFHEDGTHKPSYKASLKDSTEEEVTKNTYVPNTLTFEEDLMQKLGIKEERKKTFKTYWY